MKVAHLSIRVRNPRLARRLLSLVKPRGDLPGAANLVRQSRSELRLLNPGASGSDC